MKYFAVAIFADKDWASYAVNGMLTLHFVYAEDADLAREKAFQQRQETVKTKRRLDDGKEPVIPKWIVVTEINGEEQVKYD